MAAKFKVVKVVRNPTHLSVFGVFSGIDAYYRRQNTNITMDSITSPPTLSVLNKKMDTFAVFIVDYYI